jgi:CopA family copper-resistance protein
MNEMKTSPLLNPTFTRRKLLEHGRDFGLLLLSAQFFPSTAFSAESNAVGQSAKSTAIELLIDRKEMRVGDRIGKVVTINGTSPGPIIRLNEGEEAVIRVKNNLDEPTSIHWHGVLVPADMDGVPGVSFKGIPAGATFIYKFKVMQSGTYWYHSHTGGQELQGMFGAIIIEPIKSEPLRFDREHVIMLSDWTPIEPVTLIKKLKKNSGYFNYQKRTITDFAADTSQNGFGVTLADRLQWAKMRMDPTDFSDITGATYSYLVNGMTPDENWSGTFKKGEKVRLRFICAAAMTIFDVRLPGLKLNVVSADGQAVQPVEVEEFRIAPGETYDVIVDLKDDKAFTIFAEAIDRSGFASGTLSVKLGVKGAIPERRKRAVRGMDDMGMSMAAMSSIPAKGMDMPGMDMQGMKMKSEVKPHGNNSLTSSPIPGSSPVRHGLDHHGPGNSMIPSETKNRFNEPGAGLDPNERRVLVYTDLKSIVPYEDQREPNREIELHLTGNMERYMWSIDGKKYSESEAPIQFEYGERLRVTFVNDTMMEHPMHLHGMWMYPENGNGNYLPRKHTIIVKPAERVSVAVSANALGRWAFHCHMLLHMHMGMFRVVEVTGQVKRGDK